MLDKRTSFLLAKINELCAEGSYKIVEKGELLSCFPERLQIDEEGLKQMMNYLQEHRYIDIRYAEDGVYCVCPLPDGRRYFEDVREAKGATGRNRRDIVLLTVIGGFLGAFLGSVCVWLITTLLF